MHGMYVDRACACLEGSPAEQRDAIAALAKQALALAPAVGGDSESCLQRMPIIITTPHARHATITAPCSNN